ncbi:predicted protein [Chaetoceros tenuissimus]|uniref:Uncharacterized protein n=1 Tax=Chaetoceros tenuissimus TaxID=426638 RepID=A0AAD3CJI8_9STRA|nr:predicted protein [Chaetoceros tenuissimus]
MNSSMFYNDQQRRSTDSLGSEEFSTRRISYNQRENLPPQNPQVNSTFLFTKSPETSPSNEIQLAQKVLEEARSRRISTKFASLSSSTEIEEKRIQNLAAFDSLPQLHKLYDSKRENNDKHTRSINHKEFGDVSSETDMETITSVMEELKFHHRVIESYYQQTKSNGENGQREGYTKGQSSINNMVEDFLHSYEDVIRMTEHSSSRSSFCSSRSR